MDVVFSTIRLANRAGERKMLGGGQKSDLWADGRANSGFGFDQAAGNVLSGQGIAEKSGMERNFICLGARAGDAGSLLCWAEKRNLQAIFCDCAILW